MSENNSSVFNELRLGQELCDAIIRVDNVEIPVHKVILCNCSPYFRALFTHWSTPDSRVFDIPNISSDMMKLIVEFAYTGSVYVTKDKLRELFIAADQFNVRGIIQTCSDQLERQLTPENCISTWWFADIYYNPELKHKAYMFILNHFEEVAASSDEFLQISAQELAQIIENDRLNVKKEKTVFESVIRWITYIPEERRDHIYLLLSKVRLALINGQYLIENVLNNKLVEASKECQAILSMTVEAMETILDQQFGDVISSNPLAQPRLPSSILLAVGGWSAGGPTNDIQAYDIRADCWVNIANNSGDPRAYHGAAFLNGSLYFVGGFDGVMQFNTMTRFDLITRTLQEVSPMHTRRCYVSVTVLDGCIYAIGGYDGHERLETAERYEPSTNQWSLIASMHDQRSDASCTTVNGKVYICGGFNGSECLSSAECYNPKTDQWTLIATMGYQRSGIGVVAYGYHVIVVGGFDGTNRLETAEAYNTFTNTWHTLPSMLNPCSNFGIEVIDDHIIVVGGFNGLTTTCDVQTFDFEMCQWYSVCDMETSCSATSCCVMRGLPNMEEYAAPRPSLQFSDEELDEVE